MLENKFAIDFHPVILEDVSNIISNKRINWDKLKSKTVLITGASGLIGSYLVYTLLCLNEIEATNIHVIALVRNRFKAEKQFAGLNERDDFTILIQDVTSPLEYNEDIHYIIHAASKTGPRDMIADPVGTITANAIGTLQMLETAKEKNATFLYLSSREIYGNTDSKKLTITENEYGTFDHTLVRSCYPESKRMSETLCSAYNHQYHVQAKIARLSHVYGPDYSLGSGRVWGEFLINEACGENIVLKSQGLAELAFMYVSDAISGLFFVLLNGDDMIYNISDSSSIIQVRMLAELISGFSDKHLKPIFDIPKDSAYSTSKVAFLNSDKIESLGWKPDVSIQDGFFRTAQVFHDYMKKRCD